MLRIGLLCFTVSCSSGQRRGTAGYLRCTAPGTTSSSILVGVGVDKKCRDLEWTGSNAGSSAIACFGGDYRTRCFASMGNFTTN